jgi:N-acetylglucosamine malate deacetylase 2
LREKLEQLEPDCILTHAFEGGHPDHDATAFAVHQSGVSCPIIEMAGYHLHAGKFRCGEFLQPGPVFVRELSAAEQEQKRALFGCYKSQWQTLSLFPTDVEKFRFAPAYDFGRPPHGGPLHYENYPWNMTSSLWTELARQAA